CEFALDRVVVVVAVFDRVVKDRRIGCEPGDRQLIDVAPKHASSQQVARYVVEPEALAQIVQRFGWSHRITLGVALQGRTALCGWSARIAIQARPSRASSRSAASGPALPAA